MNRIIYLNNQKASKIGFNRRRGFDPPKSENLPKVISESKKVVFNNLKATFIEERETREQNKTLLIPKDIDLIKIYFLKTFNKNLHNQLLQEYGISPVEYLDFNKTVLFQIENSNLFQNFLSHLDSIINSSEGTEYYQMDYNLLALIHSFEFFGTEQRIQTISFEGVILSLINTHLNVVYETQVKYLVQYLKEISAPFIYDPITPQVIEILRISTEELKLIADNFDIIKAVTSSRTQKIRPGFIGPIREYGFSVEVRDNIPVVGIIDTGISKIEPFQNLIHDYTYNHTSFPEFWDEEGHGTLVAGLVVLGDEFYLEEKDIYSAKAKLLNIKAIHQSNDDINIPQLIFDIKDARRNLGVRLFNMSLVIPQAKKYNETYSRFALELDKLAHAEDLLIFLSVGNFDDENLKALKTKYSHAHHEYPDFFYNLDSESESHMCEDTNICVPAESLNNISVGAIAGNFDADDNSDATPNSLYPAHYTRKFHLDYKQKVNGTLLSKNNKNYNLNKPDFIMEGGDLFEYNSGIEILRSPQVESEKFYGRTCGTSLSTPLLCSYAAEILYQYPTIRMQSVKSILINCADYHKKQDLPHFSNSSDYLLKSLIGFGKPEKSNLLFTNDNSIMYLIEGNIEIEQIIKYPIIIPDYLLIYENKLQFDISLAYSFSPIEDNHLDYNPLHISFSLVKNVSIDNVADKKEKYGIKDSFSWSEDHHGIDNCLFSNAQKKTFRLQPKDIVNCSGEVAIAVRCLGKNNHLDKLKDIEHPFSLVVRVTEIITNENDSGLNLYSEMMKINNFLDIDMITEADLEADL